MTETSYRLLLLVLPLGLLLPACQKKAPPLSSEGAPIFLAGQPAAPRRLVAASFGTCVKRLDGFWCWGSIGNGVSPDKPTRLEGADDVEELVLGGSHYCVVSTDRRVACAGRNFDGELGDGTFENRTTLTPVRGLSNVVQLAAGSFKTCAIVAVDSKREIRCFGSDEGNGTRGTAARSPWPKRIGDFDDARELVVEWGIACVRRQGGTVWCWGEGQRGELGNGVGDGFGKRPSPPTNDPVKVLYVGDAIGLCAGGFRVCALTARATVGCWGENSYGALGDGTTRSRAYPSDVVGLADITQIATGGFGHTCALARRGDVWCWGYPIGETGAWRRDRPKPERVPGIDDATEIASGHTHTCARRRNGSVVCWGDNSEGQLGDGTRIPTTTPREVLGPE
jgi:alpha-tubulin suppressor-like RCC1 family protein